MASTIEGIRIRTKLIAALVACAVAVLAGPGAGRAIAASEGGPPPNVVLITTDDQPADTLMPETMPNLLRRMAPGGSSFRDYIVTTPLCCPSRATLLTGQYGHNNGVLRNDYALLRQKRNVLPGWLQKAGYKTAHVGKYPNGYGDFAESKRDVAPGWNLWFTQFERKAYYNWKASKNGRRMVFGEENRDHVTEAVSRQASRWTRRLVAKPEPFFMQVDYYAPHTGGGRDDRCRRAPEPAPAEVGRFDSEPLPQPASFNEEDITDKPSEVSALPLLDDEQIARMTSSYRCALESLLSVDRGIERIFRKVRDGGELHRTLFIFTSDNGYFYGEHRIELGKQYPYEENLRMPLLVRPPLQYRGGPGVEQIDDPVANLDIVPTILDLADVDPCLRIDRCRVLDGRSLRPLLAGEPGWPQGRGLIVERNTCAFRGVRSRDEIYVEHDRGGVPANGLCSRADAEFYDLATDPDQLDNLYPAPEGSALAARQQRLRDRMADLGKCAGIPGRDPRPESGIWCE